MSEPSQRSNLELTRTVVDISIKLGILLLVFLMCFNILSPFIVPVIWGAIIVVAIYPIYVILSEKLGGKYKLAATLYTLMALAILILPAFMIADSLVETAGTIKDRYDEGKLSIPAPADKVRDWPLIGKRVHAEWTRASVSLSDALEQHASQIKTLVKFLASAAAGAGIGVLQFALSVIISGVLLVYAVSASGFSIRFFSRIAGDSKGHAYARLTTQTIRSVAQGVLGVALIQAILGGLGMFLIDVPAWGLWTIFILVLATVFLIYSLIVSASDGFLKPIFLGRGMETPMLVILLGAIGGMLAWGIIGLFIGAIILSLGYELFLGWLNQVSIEAKISDAETIE
jgi:predicted PurR-regulated permease PerM